MIDVELFAGAGGMAAGLRVAGFGPAHLYEVDKYACDTLRLNSKADSRDAHWTVHERDLQAAVNWKEVNDTVRLLAAGAPCQPFSLGGRHKAYDDGRNLFPKVLHAIRGLRPAVVVLENVRGLVRESFFPYWEYILAQLECPSVAPRRDELWQDHHRRVKKHRCGVRVEPEYHVEWRVVDAADYGVPQNRFRVVIVATRKDLPRFSFPPPTHSRDALVTSQLSGQYWEEHDIKQRKPLCEAVSPSLDLEERLLPWVTVRDGLKGLPAAAHWSIPGARSYAGHGGSQLDWPSKTIKAGVHGVPGGENTVLDHNGKIRYYTLRETARIQSFPDSHVFSGRRLHVTKQIGNAVPVALATAIAHPLRKLVADAFGEERALRDKRYGSMALEDGRRPEL
jgi:DNA (cytosine-5)-methyltransferase 1